MGQYTKKDLETLIYKIDSEGFWYALCEYSNWEEFSDTPLGEAIQEVRNAIDKFDILLYELKEQYDIETD